MRLHLTYTNYLTGSQLQTAVDGGRLPSVRQFIVQEAQQRFADDSGALQGGDCPRVSGERDADSGGRKRFGEQGACDYPPRGQIRFTKQFDQVAVMS